MSHFEYKHFSSVPPPYVLLEEVDMPWDGILYAGLNHTLRCNVDISDLSVPFVTVSIHWLKDEYILKNCSDLKNSNSYHCLLTLTRLSYVSDNGSYSCRADVTPTASYPPLTARSVTSTSLDLRVASKFRTYILSQKPFLLLPLLSLLFSPFLL